MISNLENLIGSPRKLSVLIIFIAALLFVPFLGKVHLFDWDEINFAEAAREMTVTGDYSTVRIDYHSFHEKPPLFIWLQVLSMKAFGISEFAARFPNAIIGIITLFIIFNIGAKLKDTKFGLLWVMMYIGSYLPHFYFKTGLIDPTFNLFMYLGIYYIYKFYRYDLSKHLYLAGFLISIAILTKGPVGFLLPSITWAIFHFIKYRFKNIPFSKIGIYTLISFTPLVLWYIYIAYSSEAFVLNEFIKYHLRLLSTGDAGHSGPIYYHVIILLIGCFPASAIALSAFRFKEDKSGDYDFWLWNIVLFSVVLVIFSLVQTKIIHYSSLCYFPLTYLAATALYTLYSTRARLKTYQMLLIIIIGLVWSALLIGFPYFLANKDMFLHLIKDKVAIGLLRDNKFNISMSDYLAGISLLIGVILYIFTRKKINSVIYLCAAVIISVLLILPITAPKIEAALQGEPIRFYQNLRNQDVYVITAGFKSYAPYFYNERKYENSSAYRNLSGDEFEKYLIENKLTKNLYIVTKINFDTTKFSGKSIKLIRSFGGYNYFEKPAGTY